MIYQRKSNSPWPIVLLVLALVVAGAAQLGLTIDDFTRTESRGDATTPALPPPADAAPEKLVVAGGDATTYTYAKARAGETLDDVAGRYGIDAGTAGALNEDGAWHETGFVRLPEEATLMGPAQDEPAGEVETVTVHIRDPEAGIVARTFGLDNVALQAPAIVNDPNLEFVFEDGWTPRDGWVPVLVRLTAYELTVQERIMEGITNGHYVTRNECAPKTSCIPPAVQDYLDSRS